MIGKAFYYCFIFVSLCVLIISHCNHETCFDILMTSQYCSKVRNKEQTKSALAEENFSKNQT